MCKHLRAVLGAGMQHRVRPAVLKEGQYWYGGNVQGAFVGESPKDVMEAMRNA